MFRIVVTMDYVDTTTLGFSCLSVKQEIGDGEVVVYVEVTRKQLIDLAKAVLPVFLEDNDESGPCTHGCKTHDNVS